MEPTTKKCKSRKKTEKLVSSEVRGIHGVSPEEEKVDCSGKNLQTRKVLSLE